MRRTRRTQEADEVAGLVDAHRKLAELKYLYLCVADDPSADHLAKLALRTEMVLLANAVQTAYPSGASEGVNARNGLDGVLRMAARARRHGLRLVGRRVDLGRLPMADEAVDARLRDGPMEADLRLEARHLEGLGAIRSRLLVRSARLGAAEPPSRQDAAGKELVSVKVRAYEEGLKGCAVTNVDVLVRVVSRIAAAVEAGAAFSVLDPAGPPQAPVKAGEIHVGDLGKANVCVYMKETRFALWLQILASADSGDGRLPYRGEVSGWAEAGANRVEFSVHDQTSPPGGMLDAPEGQTHFESFLRKTGLAGIYPIARQACEAEQAADAPRGEPTNSGAKDAVLRALDDSL